MGAAGSGFADAVSAASSSPQVNDVIQQSLEGLNLKSDPKVVIEGVAVRLLKGDSEGARNFLARQAGMSNSEAQSRIDQVTEQVKTALAETREAAARTLSTAGWTLFGLMVIGLLAAIGGGALGSRTNLRRPLSDEELTPMYHTTTSAAS